MNAVMKPIDQGRNPAAMGPSSVRVTRSYAASPEKVFRAWTDQASLKTWFAKDQPCSFDVREGGLFYVAMFGASKLNHHYGRYLRVDSARALEFTWVSEWTAGKESAVLIEFAVRDGKTELTLTHDGLPNEEFAAMHRGGWTSFLDELVEHLH